MSKLLILLLVFMLPVSSVYAEFPIRKPGLWQVVTSVEGESASQLMKQCIDESTDEKMARLARSMNKRPGVACSKDERRKDNERYVTESDCMSQGVRVRAYSVLSGDFESKYTGYTLTRYEPPIRGMAEQRVNIVAIWLGACEAWQKPGDTVMPGGATMNVDDLLNESLGR